MKYSYQSEKFSKARSCLMLPHPSGEAVSIAHAFHECHLGMRDLDVSELGDTPREWVRQLEELMETDGLSDANGKGLWQIKAERLKDSEKFKLSEIVNELAHWFDREFHDSYNN